MGLKGPRSEATAGRAGTHFGCGHAGSCWSMKVDPLRGRREARDTHRRRAGSGSVFWPACVLGTGASFLGIRNVKWPEVRLSLTPAAPLHPPAASKDPQTPFCVCGSQIQQLFQCMWAILKVLSPSPSSVEFHHIARRLQRGSGAPKLPGPCRTQSHAATLLPCASRRPHSGCLCGASRVENCPGAVRELFSQR